MDIISIAKAGANYVVILIIFAIVIYFALKFYAKIEKSIIKEAIDEAIAKLDDKIKIIHSLRSLKKYD